MRNWHAVTLMVCLVVAFLVLILGLLPYLANVYVEHRREARVRAFTQEGIEDLGDGIFFERELQVAYLPRVESFPEYVAFLRIILRKFPDLEVIAVSDIPPSTANYGRVVHFRKKAS